VNYDVGPRLSVRMQSCMLRSVTAAAAAAAATALLRSVARL